MSTKFRNVLAVLIATTALAAGSAASAGVLEKAAGKLRDQGSDQGSGQQSDQKPAPKPDASPPRDDRSRGTPGRATPPPRDNGRESRGEDRGRDRPASPQGGGRGRGSSRDLNDSLARLHGNDRGNDRERGGSVGGNGHNSRPPRVVQRLPDGHRDYNWNGNRYYVYGGRWYRPYGSSFVSIGIPFGLFVGTLPGLYTSFWFGDTRYFYADRTYYVYEPMRRGYVVTHSPYGDDDEEYNDDSRGDDLYVYPARGQSEQQQADDRYACHRWAAQESHYDPLDDEYNADLRKDYQRAMSACLTGRGYTVN